MANSLDIDEDMGDVEFVQDLEEAFGIRFDPDETMKWVAVGDAYDAICARFDDGGSRVGACADAMAFYRLRRALVDRLSGQRLRPSTPLAEFGTSARRLFECLGSQTALTMPVAPMTWVGGLALCLILAGIFGWFVIFAGVSGWYPAVALVSGVVLLRLDPGWFPKDCDTVGDLARLVAPLNYGKLREAGARSRLSDIWKSLLAVASRHSELPQHEIRPDTYFMRSALNASRGRSR